MNKKIEKTELEIQGLKIIQRNDLQNITLDSVLISDFVNINRKSKNILDIGSGNGIISLLISKKTKAKIKGVEIQKDNFLLSCMNSKINNIENVEFLNFDINDSLKVFEEQSFDIIVTNPPYLKFDGNINQISKNENLSNARHEIKFNIENMIKLSYRLLKDRGSFNIIFRSERLSEFIKILSTNRLEPKRLKFVFTKGDTAKFCMLQCIKNSESGMIIERPIYVYDENNEKTLYIQNLYSNIKNDRIDLKN